MATSINAGQREALRHRPARHRSGCHGSIDRGRWLSRCTEGQPEKSVCLYLLAPMGTRTLELVRTYTECESMTRWLLWWSVEPLAAHGRGQDPRLSSFRYASAAQAYLMSRASIFPASCHASIDSGSTPRSPDGMKERCWGKTTAVMTPHPWGRRVGGGVLTEFTVWRMGGASFRCMSTTLDEMNSTAGKLDADKTSSAHLCLRDATLRVNQEAGEAAWMDGRIVINLVGGERGVGGTAIVINRRGCCPRERWSPKFWLVSSSQQIVKHWRPDQSPSERRSCPAECHLFAVAVDPSHSRSSALEPAQPPYYSEPFFAASRPDVMDPEVAGWQLAVSTVPAFSPGNQRTAPPLLKLQWQQLRWLTLAVSLNILDILCVIHASSTAIFFS